MKRFIDIAMKRIYLFNIVAWNYRKKIGFAVCKKENFAGLQAHGKRGKSVLASPTPHHTLNEERSARFTTQHLSALIFILWQWSKFDRWVREENLCSILNLVNFDSWRWQSFVSTCDLFNRLFPLAVQESFKQFSCLEFVFEKSKRREAGLKHKLQL